MSDDTWVWDDIYDLADFSGPTVAWGLSRCQKETPVFRRGMFYQNTENFKTFYYSFRSSLKLSVLILVLKVLLYHCILNLLVRLRFGKSLTPQHRVRLNMFWRVLRLTDYFPSEKKKGILVKKGYTGIKDSDLEFYVSSN